MSLRFRKSIKISNGVRLNVSKTGVGIGIGSTGMRMSVHSSGRKTASVGVPGSGLYYQVQEGGGSSGRRTQSQNTGSGKNQTVNYGNGVSYTYTPNDCALYNQLIHTLTESFQECSPQCDWSSILNSPEPFDKNHPGPKERNAYNDFVSLKPKLSEKLNKSKFEQRRQDAYQNVLDAREEDRRDYDAWAASKNLAKGVLDKDIDAYYDAINAADPFVSLSKLGNDFEFGTDDPKLMEVEFCVKFDEVIPQEKLSLISTGKVSVKKMGKTEMYDITQDYVCSLAIRLAREIFAVIPVDVVIVHADEKTVDAFGVDKKQTILSVKFERAVFDKTNFARIDASDFVHAFIHNEKFLKTKGFREVDRILPDDVDARVVPTEASRTSRETTNKSVNLNKVELPFGWYAQNQMFVGPRDNKAYELRNKAMSADNVDDELKGLREYLSYLLSYRDECISKGIYFEKHFEDMHMTNGGKKVDTIKQIEKRISEIEDNYIDLKSIEDAVKLARRTMKDDLVRIISDNPGILQKNLYPQFDPQVKSILQEKLYELQTEGRLKKEKSGNSNKLWIVK